MSRASTASATRTVVTESDAADGSRLFSSSCPPRAQQATAAGTETTASLEVEDAEEEPQAPEGDPAESAEAVVESMVTPDSGPVEEAEEPVESAVADESEGKEEEPDDKS